MFQYAINRDDMNFILDALEFLRSAVVLQHLIELNIVKKLGDGLKVLGNGELKRKITVKANLFSKSAEEKIKAAGGSAGR